MYICYNIYNMLAKKNRLTKKEFNELYKNGKKKHTKNFFIIFENSEIKKISIVAPTKKFKKAFLRNRKRRKIYNFLKDNDFLNKKKIIIFLKNTKKITFECFKKELEKI